jgi:hypothetical protein
MSLAGEAEVGAPPPCGDRSALALVLHVLAWATSVIYVPVLLAAYRAGHLRFVQRGDGDQLFGAALGTCFLVLLQLALHALTVHAFGGKEQVPAGVRTVRRIVVVGTWVVLVTAAAYTAQLGSGCFRTCAPFPH